jgi:acyl-CoA reductase-like NAD-dependent aldehyde dehydrogenase
MVHPQLQLTVVIQALAGQVFVNEWFAGGVEEPFSGGGHSSYGSEKGREALFNSAQTKNTVIRIARRGRK